MTRFKPMRFRGLPKLRMQLLEQLLEVEACTLHLSTLDLTCFFRDSGTKNGVRQ